jgi:PAS domain-containing protein
MKRDLIGADDLLTTFAQQRQVLLKHTAEVLCGEPTVVRVESDVQRAKLSAILVSSLEELKVAEEELVERTEQLADLRDQLERREHGARQLFDFAPVCLLVTDRYGKILEANHATATLFKRPLEFLEQQPLANFIAAEKRRSFRDGLTRVAETDGVDDWRLELVRPTDTLLNVTAAVRVVKPLGPGNNIRLFWSLTAPEPAGGGGGTTRSLIPNE